MSESWYLMNSSNDRVSGYELDDFENSAASGFDELLNFSPESRTLLLNNSQTKMIVQNTSKENTLQILGKMNQFKSGDIVTYESNNYLVAELPHYNKFYLKSEIKLCSGQLKWIDDDGEINSRYFTFKSDPATNFGTDNGSIVVLGSERRTLLVSFDEDTTNFRKDRRFIFDGRAWKITALDNISLKGIAIVTVQEDLINTATDNLELGIADYYGNVANYSVTINNGSFVTISDDQLLRLNVIVTNNSIPLPSPSLSYTSSDERIATVSFEGTISPLTPGTVIITATYKNVSAQIKVSITDSTAFSYTCEIIGPNEIKVGRTQSYTAKFYRNGVEYPDKSRFSLTSDDGVSPTKLASVSFQDEEMNTCSIVAGSSIGYVYLHVKNDNGLSESKIRIRIKPLY
ncbi:Ig-like domain-containing protein [Paenibacillus sp. FSL H3-0333]|uniref:Ig-like domain-containing protein n=1 Tax=Paenibacillus sp. FSL H3-0333 TaxID=2921373 RepID=UPI0030FCDC50